jgi:N-acylneuraminate cytidylyltransferase
MLHAIEEMERRRGRYDAVLLLQPTSPLRLPGTIDRALEQFTTSGCDSQLGVVESHAFVWKRDPIRANYDFRNRPRRQDIGESEKRFRETGALYLTLRDALLAEQNRLAGRIALFLMQECEGWEIDSITDFSVLEALMKQEGLA